MPFGHICDLPANCRLCMRVRLVFLNSQTMASSADSGADVGVGGGIGGDGGDSVDLSGLAKVAALSGADADVIVKVRGAGSGASGVVCVWHTSLCGCVVCLYMCVTRVN